MNAAGGANRQLRALKVDLAPGLAAMPDLAGVAPIGWNEHVNGSESGPMSDNAADSIVGLYHSHAASWVRLRGRDLIERSWLDRFLAKMPEEGREVLDIGCGSGQPISEYLIENSCQITGVDGAAALIEIAHANFPEQTWIVADMRNLPSLGQFHGLVVWHSLFHLRPEEQRPMFETFGRLCCPNAALIFTSGTEFGEAIGTFEGQPLYHASLDSAEYSALLQSSGFDLIQRVENDLSCGGANVWLARKMPTGSYGLKATSAPHVKRGGLSLRRCLHCRPQCNSAEPQALESPGHAPSGTAWDDLGAEQLCLRSHPPKRARLLDCHRRYNQRSPSDQKPRRPSIRV